MGQAQARKVGSGRAPLAGIRRRDALRTFGGTVLAAAAGGTLIDACSSPSSPAPSAHATAGSPSKVINVVIPADPPALDPVKYNAHEIERVYRQVTEQLYQWNANKTITPFLASAMPTVSADGLTYTVPLRSGITFHNGKPFNSADVKYTCEQILRPANGSIWLAALGLVDTVSAPDPRTVVIKLKAPYTPLLSSMALIPILPSNIAYAPAVYARSLIGTGPFKFVNWTQGVSIQLTRNQEYWQAGLPKSAGITFSVVATDASQIADLATNTGQLIAEVSARDVSVLKSHGATVFIEDQSSIFDYMYPNLGPGKFTANVDARLAIAWAINRGQVIQQVFAGIGNPESTLPVHGTEYYDPVLGGYFGSSPDLAKAKSYLAKAGGPPSKPLEIVVLSNDITNPTVAIVQQNLKAAGIPATITSLGETAALARLFAQDYDLFLLDVLAQESTGFGSYIAYLATYPGAFANFNKFSNPEMSRLATQAVTVTSSAAQAAAWKAVQQAWLAMMPLILICSSRYIEAASSTLRGYQPTGLAQLENLKYASVA